jgi:hypothetical protein
MSVVRDKTFHPQEKCVNNMSKNNSPSGERSGETQDRERCKYAVLIYPKQCDGIGLQYDYLTHILCGSIKVHEYDYTLSHAYTGTNAKYWSDVHAIHLYVYYDVTFILSTEIV